MACSIDASLSVEQCITYVFSQSQVHSMLSYRMSFRFISITIIFLCVMWIAAKLNDGYGNGTISLDELLKSIAILLGILMFMVAVIGTSS